MTANEVGRNDPCPCGSGRKYKHCCLRKDRQRRRVRVTASSAHPREQADNLLGRIRQLARQVKSRRPDDAAKDLLEGLEELEERAAFEVLRDDIQEAGLILEEHRAEYEELMADPASAMDRAYRLFSEEQFAHMRYSVQDLEQAFEAVGCPSQFGEEPSQEDMETMLAVSLHLAGDRENRQRLARQLMTALPEYVAAGRYQDAWLIQHSAYLTAEGGEQSSPFLFAMLQLAYEEWEQRVAKEQEALMRELGIDPSALRGAGIHEMEALYEELVADPGKQARMEAFYEAHPAFREQATAEMMQLERGALKLLERDDAECLLLSVEEVAPWLPVLQEQLEPLVGQVREAMASGEEPDPSIVVAVQEGMVELTREMAPAVFTPERVEQLVTDLKDYQRSLGQAGEREEAAWAYGALASVRADGSPADKPFLLALCFASLRRVMRAAGEGTRAADAGDAEPVG